MTNAARQPSRATPNSKGGVPSPYNITPFNKLPSSAEASGLEEAVLLVWDTNPAKQTIAWEFLINPQSINVKNSANYSPIATIGNKQSAMLFNYTEGEEYTISDLILKFWCCGKSLDGHLSALKALAEATFENGTLQRPPPVMRFRWSSFTLAPIILLSYDYDITALKGGSVTDVVIRSLTFKRIPELLTPAQLDEREKRRADEFQAAREAKNTPALRLTDRQADEAVRRAEKYLKDNIKELSPEVASDLNIGNFKLFCDPETGVVLLTGGKKGEKKYGTVLQYDGKMLRAGPQLTTVPLAQGSSLAKLPKLEEKAQSSLEGNSEQSLEKQVGAFEVKVTDILKKPDSADAKR